MHLGQVTLEIMLTKTSVMPWRRCLAVGRNTEKISLQDQFETLHIKGVRTVHDDSLWRRLSIRLQQRLLFTREEEM